MKVINPFANVEPLEILKNIIYELKELCWTC